MYYSVWNKWNNPFTFASQSNSNRNPNANKSRKGMNNIQDNIQQLRERTKNRFSRAKGAQKAFAQTLGVSTYSVFKILSGETKSVERLKQAVDFITEYERIKAAELQALEQTVLEKLNQAA